MSGFTNETSEHGLDQSASALSPLLRIRLNGQ